MTKEDCKAPRLQLSKLIFFNGVGGWRNKHRQTKKYQQQQQQKQKPRSWADQLHRQKTDSFKIHAGLIGPTFSVIGVFVCDKRAACDG